MVKAERISQAESQGCRKEKREQRHVAESKWVVVMQARVTFVRFKMCLKLNHDGSNKLGVYMKLKCSRVFAEVCKNTLVVW